MDSRLIRILFVVAAIAIGVNASYFLKTIETQIVGSRSASDTLRGQGSALLATLADVRAAQVAYVAQGQGEAFWMDRVSKLLPVIEQQMADFKAALTSPEALADLDPAIAAIENFHKLDARAQEYVKGSDPLLAADLIFSDGLEAIGAASTQVQVALNHELQSRNASAAGLQARQWMMLGGSAGGILLILMMLGFTGARKPEQAQASDSMPVSEPITFTKVIGADPNALASVARVCTEMGRVMDTKQLPALLERTAKVLDASGMIVWVADSSGRELRPAMAFGYSDQVLAKMGAIPRDAANAAAAAYRAGEMRTVTGDGFTNGALVAPLMTADGCIGVLSVEMKGGSELDESSQALASIFAAQLATLVSPPASASLSLAAEA